jgi:Tol biopolymer transport system component
MAKRKILLISILITLGAIAFLSGYLLMPEVTEHQTGLLIQRFNKKEPAIVNNDTLLTTPVSSRKILSFTGPSLAGKITAIDKDGNIFEIDTHTLREATVSALKHKEISEVFLSPGGNSIVYSFYEAGNSKKHLYLDIKTSESIEINGEVRSVAFSPDSSQAAYLINNDSGGEILIYKGIDAISQTLKTRIGAATINWPSEDFLSIISYNKSGYGDLFILKSGGILNKIISYQYDLNAKWSSSAEKILFSTKDSGGSDHLFYKDIENNEPVVALNVSANASKCIWVDGENVICGITDQIQLKDEFYQINTTDGSKILVSKPSINLLTKKLSLFPSKNTLFVLNDIDDKLYALTMDKVL